MASSYACEETDQRGSLLYTAFARSHFRQRCAHASHPRCCPKIGLHLDITCWGYGRDQYKVERALLIFGLWTCAISENNFILCCRFNNAAYVHQFPISFSVLRRPVERCVSVIGPRRVGDEQSAELTKGPHVFCVRRGTIFRKST